MAMVHRGLPRIIPSCIEYQIFCYSLPSNKSYVINLSQCLALQKRRRENKTCNDIEAPLLHSYGSCKPLRLRPIRLPTSSPHRRGYSTPVLMRTTHWLSTSTSMKMTSSQKSVPLIIIKALWSTTRYILGRCWVAQSNRGWHATSNPLYMNTLILHLCEMNKGQHLLS